MLDPLPSHFKIHLCGGDTCFGRLRKEKHIVYYDTVGLKSEKTCSTSCLIFYRYQDVI